MKKTWDKTSGEDIVKNFKQKDDHSSELSKPTIKRQNIMFRNSTVGTQFCLYYCLRIPRYVLVIFCSHFAQRKRSSSHPIVIYTRLLGV